MDFNFRNFLESVMYLGVFYQQFPIISFGTLGVRGVTSEIFLGSILYFGVFYRLFDKVLKRDPHPRKFLKIRS